MVYLLAFCESHSTASLVPTVVTNMEVNLQYACFRFYPSLASVSTHFTKYRATALGIVAAGSSVGACKLRSSTPRALIAKLTAAGDPTGGVVYPIILQRIFISHGFRIGVLVSGLASAVACVVSALTVTTASKPTSPSHLLSGAKPKPKVQRKLFDLKSITDTRFALLVVGSCFVALGA